MARPERIACAASYGADPAHTMPPPFSDAQSSCAVPKCSWYAAAVNWSPENGTYMIPSMSVGRRPASASARSVACAAIWCVVRPEARE